jgi:HEAT repeat protein
MGEDNARAVRRLRDILIMFGKAAREYANELKSSRNPAVRRAAIDLLRRLGGEAALPDLRNMLDDTDAQVQREALRGIVQIGTNEAYKVLENALERGADRTKDAIMQAIGGFRDEKAAPLFVYILNHTDYRGANEGNYVATIESLGKVATDERSVAALREILYRGEWWSWGRTARLRTAAARALRNMGMASADRVLEEAATSGPGAVKKSARAALLEPAPPKRARKDKAKELETSQMEAHPLDTQQLETKDLEPRDLEKEKQL